jgi:hypothetical protein
VIARPAEAVRRAKEAVVRGLELPLDEALQLDWRLAQSLGRSRASRGTASLNL